MNETIDAILMDGCSTCDWMDSAGGRRPVGEIDDTSATVREAILEPTPGLERRRKQKVINGARVRLLQYSQL